MGTKEYEEIKQLEAKIKKHIAEAKVGKAVIKAKKRYLGFLEWRRDNQRKYEEQKLAKLEKEIQRETARAERLEEIQKAKENVAKAKMRQMQTRPEEKRKSQQGTGKRQKTKLVWFDKPRRTKQISGKMPRISKKMPRLR